jgi:pimeloyl-ACP methyl ester carboxylesterase
MAMSLFSKSMSSRLIGTGLASSAALAALALASHLAARRAERKHPPTGSFIDVDGVRLHYSDRGEGSPVLLIHGEAVSGDDFNTSGVAELLLQTHRVIIFDRPGFGYSARPRGRMWTAAQQAELLHKAVTRLGVERPVIVGHSWGAIVALAFAEKHSADTAGLVLLSGYYFWTLRPDVLLVAAGAIPGIGDILSYTISPLLGWLTVPVLKRALFSPAPVPARFKAEYSPAMALRPSQLRATSVDATLMIPAVLNLQDHYKELSLPVVIMAGDGDKIVHMRRAKQLEANIKGSVLEIVKGAGHMVHYLAMPQVVDAVNSVSKASRGSTFGEPHKSKPSLQVAPETADAA